MIGWDLILEYAVGSATVANGWSGYFQSVLAKFGVHLAGSACRSADHLRHRGRAFRADRLAWSIFRRS